MKVLILNGPNLNLLGKREVAIYGNKSFEEYYKEFEEELNDKDITLSYFQSNIEGELINKLHEVGFDYEGIVFNPGGYSHTSIALADAVSAITTPVVEVHISNIYAREKYRKHSYISSRAKGVISGFGLDGYKLAIQYLLNRKDVIPRAKKAVGFGRQ